jgi:hypothetical protein
MHLFPGQGVKHITEGYGVVWQVPQPMKNEKRPNTVKVKFRTGLPVVVSVIALLPAEMDIDEREDLEQEIADYPEQRGSRTVVLLGDTNETKTGRATIHPIPLQSIQVPPSGLTEIESYGGKCAHGVYVPAPYLPSGIADCCSGCRPFEIIAKSSHSA